MTLFGWDASDFDWARGPMDLAAAHADGIAWFTHKATEATNVQHWRLREGLERARDAGIEFLGAYHVVRSSPSPQAQVGYFLAYLDQQVPWWRTFPGFMLQVDLELWPYDQVPAAAGIAFANALQTSQHKQVLTYASRGMYGDSLTGIGTPLWNANYGKGNPAAHYPDAYPGDDGQGWVAYSGQTPAMWQYGSRCTIGSQSGCDANAFRGTVADLRQLITGSAGSAPASSEEDDMQRYMIARDDHTGQLYLCDGMTSRPIADVDVAHIKTLAAEGLFGLANGGATRDSWYPGAFGPVPATGGGATVGGPVDLSDTSLTAVRTIVDEQLDQQSRGGADND